MDRTLSELNHSSGLSLKLVDFTFEEFLQVRDSWDDALQRSLDNNVFLTWEWLSAWWKSFGTGRRFLLTALADGEKIHAAAPLMYSAYNLFGFRLKRVDFIGSPESDYQSFLLTEKGAEHVSVMVDHVCDIVPDWNLIDLWDIPGDSETASALKNTSTKSAKFEHRVTDTSPAIRLPANSTDFLESIDSHFRKNLRWRERRLKRDFAVDFKVVADPGAVNDAMRIFIDLHQRRRASKKPPGIFSDQRMIDFHSRVASSFAERGWLLLAFLMLNNSPAAAYYNFRYANKLYSYQSGFDPEYTRYGVGSVLDMYLIDYCIRNGVREYDFCRGDEPYKAQWRTVSRDNLQFTAAKRNVVSQLAKLISRNDRIAEALGRHASRGRPNGQT